MRHSRVIGIPNTSPEKIGGDDWDSPHVYDIGDILPIAVANLSWDVATNSVTAIAKTSALSDPIVMADAIFASLSSPTIPVPQGAAISYHCMLAPALHGPMPDGWRFEATVEGPWGEEMIQIAAISPSNTVIALPISADYWLTVFAEIIVAPPEA